MVSVKYKDREIERRGPFQHVGDECLADLLSVYDYECSTNVICLFVSFSTLADSLQSTSPVFVELRRSVKEGRKALRAKALALFREEYEANILQQGQLIGEFIQEFNKDKVEDDLRKRKTRAKTKATVLEVANLIPASEKESVNGATAGSQKNSEKSPKEQEGAAQGEGSALQPHESLLRSVRHPDTYKKAVCDEDEPVSQLVLNDTDSGDSVADSELELSKVAIHEQDENDQLETLAAIEPEADPNVTADDSALMAQPLASMAPADLDADLEASLEMAEVGGTLSRPNSAI